MSYLPQSLFSLLEQIDQNLLFLPHIQRSFVWDRDQMARLFDSLMRGFPIQTMLLWRTKEEIMPRRFMETIDWDADLHDYYLSSKRPGGIEKLLVLDGQQRLQTLYAIFAGAVKSDDGHQTEHAYFDVTSGASVNKDGLRYTLRFTAKPQELPWYRVSQLRTTRRAAFAIANEINKRLDELRKDGETPEERMQRQELVHENIGKVRAILYENGHFYSHTLDGVANDYPYEHVREIFVRVNSGGTRLSHGDLMFATMKGGWQDIEREIEEMVELLNQPRLCFEKDFAVKCLLVAHGQGAEVNPSKFDPARNGNLIGMVEKNWNQAEAAFRQLRDFIRHELGIYSDKVVRSYMSFVPLFDYLFHNPKPAEASRAWMRAYYYKAQLFNWYGSQTDATINILHGLVGKPLPAGFPLREIKQFFAASRGDDVELNIDHLLDVRRRFILLNLLYVACFGSSPFDVSFQGNEPHIDHIYPQSMLRSQLKLKTADINHLGNYRFVGATDNIRKRAQLPDSYFGELKRKGIAIEKHLLLADFSRDPSLLKFDGPTYVRFRDERIREIFKIAEPIVNAELTCQAGLSPPTPAPGA